MTENVSGGRRVALFRTNFLPWSETFIHDELRHHVRYDATVFARQHRNVERFSGHRVVAVETIPSDPHRMASLGFALTGHCERFHREFSERPFDLVHAHFAHNGVYALPYARRYGLPLVVSLHGKDVTVLMGNDRYRPAYWHYLIGYRALFRRTTLFFAASTELRDLIVSLGCPSEKVVVNLLGIDVRSFRPACDSFRAHPPRVTMVGRFVEKKGHMYGLEAAAVARQAGCVFSLCLVGDGELKNTYMRAVKRMGLDDITTFTGALSHDAVRELIQTSSVFLAPSVVARNQDRESGLIVAKEASACGVPVIGTCHGGIPDIVENEITGFLVPERDSRCLGERLMRLLKDTSLRDQMGQAARQKMEREYDIQHCVDRLEDLYDRAITLFREHHRGDTS